MRTKNNIKDATKQAGLASAALLAAASLLTPCALPGVSAAQSTDAPAKAHAAAEQDKAQQTRRAKNRRPWAGVVAPMPPAGFGPMWLTEPVSPPPMPPEPAVWMVEPMVAPPSVPFPPSAPLAVLPPSAPGAVMHLMPAGAGWLQDGGDIEDQRDEELDRMIDEAVDEADAARDRMEAEAELAREQFETSEEYAEAMREASTEAKVAMELDWERENKHDGSSDPAIQILEQGRALVEHAEWAQAVEKYRAFLTQYPQHKLADSAYYWQAYALKKQGRYQEAYDTVAKLMTGYPKSRWKDDGRTLKIELAQLLGKRDEVDAEYIRAREDEVKISALQGVFNSNPDRGVALAEDILKPGSTASPRLQRAAVFLVGQSDNPRVGAILLTAMRTSTVADVRRAAVMGLAQNSRGEGLTDQAFAALKELAAKGDDEDLARFAVIALAQDQSPRTRQLMVELATTSASKNVRRQAILSLGNYNDEQSCTELGKIYDAVQDADARRMVVNALADNESACALAKLEDLARKAAETDVRRFAIIRLADRDPNRAGGVLGGWYDAEKNETVKESLLNGLGQAAQSNSKTALQKLMQIAKNDPIAGLRKKAIFWIGQCDDPEAMRFLEDLLK